MRVHWCSAVSSMGMLGLAGATPHSREGAAAPGLSQGDTGEPVLITGGWQEDAERQANVDWDFLCKPSTVNMLKKVMDQLAARGKGKTQAKL